MDAAGRMWLLGGYTGTYYPDRVFYLDASQHLATCFTCGYWWASIGSGGCLVEFVEHQVLWFYGSFSRYIHIITHT